MSKRNWFNTLNEALESEGLLESWDISLPPIQYGSYFRWVWEGKVISIYRETDGRYERPLHYTI